MNPFRHGSIWTIIAIKLMDGRLIQYLLLRILLTIPPTISIRNSEIRMIITTSENIFSPNYPA